MRSGNTTAYDCATGWIRLLSTSVRCTRKSQEQLNALSKRQFSIYYSHMGMLRGGGGGGGIPATNLFVPVKCILKCSTIDLVSVVSVFQLVISKVDDISKILLCQ